MNKSLSACSQSGLCPPRWLAYSCIEAQLDWILNDCCEWLVMCWFCVALDVMLFWLALTSWWIRHWTLKLTLREGKEHSCSANRRSCSLRAVATNIDCIKTCAVLVLLHWFHDQLCYWRVTSCSWSDLLTTPITVKDDKHAKREQFSWWLGNAYDVFIASNTLAFANFTSLRLICNASAMLPLQPKGGKAIAHVGRWPVTHTAWPSATVALAMVIFDSKWQSLMPQQNRSNRRNW